MISLILRC